MLIHVKVCLPICLKVLLISIDVLLTGTSTGAIKINFPKRNINTVAILSRFVFQSRSIPLTISVVYSFHTYIASSQGEDKINPSGD